MLRIAVDLDGTLADMDAALEAEAGRLFEAAVDLRASLRSRPEGAPGVETPDPTATSPGMRPAMPPPDPARPRLSDRQLRQLWARVREIQNFWESLREIEPGAVARLAHAAAAARWEVLFITTRPPSAGDTTQVQSQRWLEAHGFERPSVFVVSGSRGQIASALTLDAVIDDRPENCLDVATDSRATPILVWRDTPAAVPPGATRLGITVVYSIGEAVQRLEAGTGEPRGHGFVGRLRSTLGV